jgi:hypothetical protein
MLSSDQKGNIAELAIAARAIELGVDVYRPFGEGGRFDMIFALGDSLLRIQCKWAPGSAIRFWCAAIHRGETATASCDDRTSMAKSMLSQRTAPIRDAVTSSLQRCVWPEKRFACGSLLAGTISL